MTKGARKKKLNELAVQLDDIVNAIDDLESAAQEEFDELTERAAEGPRGDKLANEIDQYQEAIGNVYSAKDALEAAL